MMYGLSDEYRDLGDANTSVAKYWYHPQRLLQSSIASLAFFASGVFRKSMKDPSVKLYRCVPTVRQG